MDSIFPRFKVDIRLPIAILLMGLVTQVDAQTSESFEDQTPTWKLRETDCQLNDKSWKQERTSDEYHSGLSSEHFSVRPGNGTRILVTHSIQPSFVISELDLRLWVKATRPKIQLMARVVFPRTQAPDGKGPLTALLRGESYEATGSWQELSLTESPAALEKLVQEQLWLLRTRFGNHVDGGEAYIDMMVLNLYTTGSEYDVWVDDLKVQGSVSARDTAARSFRKSRRRDDAVRPVSATGTQDRSPSLTQIDGNVIEIRDRPFFARMIQHNGESFALLKQLGFNTIELRNAATPEQLIEAEQLDLWLVCPPPTDIGLRAIGFEFDRVLAWSVGRHLTMRDVDSVRQTIKEIRKSDRRENRPIVGSIESDWSEFGRICNILSVGFNPIGGSFYLSQYSDWLKQRQQLAGKLIPLWATVQTQLSDSNIAQISSLGDRVPPAPVEPDQLKFLVYEALAGGARGLRFQSRSRLDGTGLVTQLRAQTLKWINIHLNQLEPWAAGGALMGRLAISDRSLEVTALQTDRSRLLLVQRPSHLEQWSTGSGSLRTVSFADTGGSTSDRAYRLAETGLIPMPLSGTSGGSQIEFQNCPTSAAVVVTQDPMVINKLSRSFAAGDGITQAQLYTDLTRHWLAIAQVIEQQLGDIGRSNANAAGALREAAQFIRQGGSLVAANSVISGNEFFVKANQRLALARLQWVQEAKTPFRSAVASPLANHCSLTPVHWKLASRMSTQSWRPNALAGGDFENLQHMIANGWQQRRTQQPNLRAQVELSSDGKYAGKLGLKLTVTSAQPNARSTLVESTPVWISSAPIDVKAGQMVRIHGWVKVPEAIQGSLDGLMIIDSLGGPDLAERIHRTEGWQEFCLYRGVPQDGPMSVTFALTGLGIGLVDEVTIRIMDVPLTQERQAAGASNGR